MENSLQTLMVTAGIGLMCWLMLRGRMKAKRRYEPSVVIPSLRHNANAVSTPAAFSGLHSTGAPTEVLKWQVEMYDLARQLKAELDSKIVVVRKLTSDYNRAVEKLNAAIAEANAMGIGSTDHVDLARRLAEVGCSQQQISDALKSSESQLADGSNCRATSATMSSSTLSAQGEGNP